MDKHILADERKSELIQAASRAREFAYTPYSRFRVGAAVLMTSGKVYTGANVENVSFGLSICAERVAIGTAVASGDTEIVAIAIVSDNDTPVFPCGACLQVMREFSGGEPPIIIVSDLQEQTVVSKSLTELLPCTFSGFKSES